MKTRTLVTLTTYCLLAACSTDKNTLLQTPISGYYKISSMTSNIAVDINNDGNTSVDLYNEIGGPHLLPDGSSFLPYDFNSIQHRMEVRPLPAQTNEARLISFNIPDQT